MKLLVLTAGFLYPVFIYAMNILFKPLGENQEKQLVVISGTVAGSCPAGQVWKQSFRMCCPAETPRVKKVGDVKTCHQCTQDYMCKSDGTICYDTINKACSRQSSKGVCCNNTCRPQGTTCPPLEVVSQKSVPAVRSSCPTGQVWKQSFRMCCPAETPRVKQVGDVKTCHQCTQDYMCKSDGTICYDTINKACSRQSAKGVCCNNVCMVEGTICPPEVVAQKSAPAAGSCPAGQVWKQSFNMCCPAETPRVKKVGDVKTCHQCTQDYMCKSDGTICYDTINKACSRQSAKGVCCNNTCRPQGFQCVGLNIEVFDLEPGAEPSCPAGKEPRIRYICVDSPSTSRGGDGGEGGSGAGAVQ